MQLTGTPFLLLAILLFVGSIGLVVVQWSKAGAERGRGRASGQPQPQGRAAGRRRERETGGRGPLRAAGFLASVLLCQATAVTLVFVLVNNANQLYDTWGDLLGTANHVRTVAAPPPDHGLVADTKRAKVLQTFKPVDDSAVPGDVRTTDLKGQLSGVDGEVVVWTPPQYDDPAYKDKTFPVVELLAGFPGSSSAWFGSMNVTKQLAPLMTSGQVTPFILVSPRVTLLGGDTDTGCADVPGKINAETWFSRDVPQMMLDNFRVDASAARWAVAGYSAGAHCATRLALEHPDRYRAAVSMSGYNDPMSEPKSLTAKDPHLREISNPLYILTHAQTPPNVAIYETGRKGDGLEDALALQQAAKAPTTVTSVENPGAHLISTWKPMVPAVFKWLSTIIPAGN